LVPLDFPFTTHPSCTHLHTLVWTLSSPRLTLHIQPFLPVSSVHHGSSLVYTTLWILDLDIALMRALAPFLITFAASRYTLFTLPRTHRCLYIWLPWTHYGFCLTRHTLCFMQTTFLSSHRTISHYRTPLLHSFLSHTTSPPSILTPSHTRFTLHTLHIHRFTILHHGFDFTGLHLHTWFSRVGHLFATVLLHFLPALHSATFLLRLLPHAMPLPLPRSPMGFTLPCPRLFTAHGTPLPLLTFTTFCGSCSPPPFTYIFTDVCISTLFRSHVLRFGLLPRLPGFCPPIPRAVTRSHTWTSTTLYRPLHITYTRFCATAVYVSSSCTATFAACFWVSRFATVTLVHVRHAPVRCFFAYRLFTFRHRVCLPLRRRFTGLLPSLRLCHVSGSRFIRARLRRTAFLRLPSFRYFRSHRFHTFALRTHLHCTHLFLSYFRTLIHTRLLSSSLPGVCHIPAWLVYSLYTPLHAAHHTPPHTPSRSHTTPYRFTTWVPFPMPPFTTPFRLFPIFTHTTRSLFGSTLTHHYLSWLDWFTPHWSFPGHYGFRFTLHTDVRPLCVAYVGPRLLPDTQLRSGFHIFLVTPFSYTPHLCTGFTRLRLGSRFTTRFPIHVLTCTTPFYGSTPHTVHWDTILPSTDTC